MHTLSVDLETYSSEEIKKAGLYKYVQAPDFQILLFAYSFDGGPVEVIDLANGRALPEALRAALFDPACTKHAYNAAFEWYCLSKLFRLPEGQRDAWLSQWRCTMLHGMYCGYPQGLDAVGKALRLPQDAQKDKSGKALIRYFCTPCKPTNRNGGRIRNLPLFLHALQADEPQRRTHPGPSPARPGKMGPVQGILQAGRGNGNGCRAPVLPVPSAGFRTKTVGN